MTTTQIIDGKAIAAALRAEIKTEAEQLTKGGTQPCFAVILVGDDPASKVYVKSKIKACREAGIESYEKRLPEESTAEEICHVIKNLNMNPKVHGILLQLPLPDHLKGDQEDLVQMIDPAKDVDGLTITNAGKLFLGVEGGHVPCTPQGSLMLIKSVKEDLTGLNAVVIGRSNLFGKPMAQLLLKENCTVTTAHSKTKDLPAVCAQADILIAAVGREKMVKGDWIKPGAIVIDVGINRMENGRLCGDVDFEDAQGIAAHISPVPGGVGPMTIACLLKNTVKAAKG